MVELSGRVATAGVQALRPARDARPYVRLNVLVDRFETDATYLSNYLIKLECWIPTLKNEVRVRSRRAQAFVP